MPKKPAPAAEPQETITIELTPKPRASRAPKAAAKDAKAAPRTRVKPYADVRLADKQLGTLGYLRAVSLTLVADDVTGEGSFTLKWTEDVTRFRVKVSRMFVFRLKAKGKVVTTIPCPGFFAKCGKTPRVLRKVITTAESDRIDDFDGSGEGAPQRCG